MVQNYWSERLSQGRLNFRLRSCYYRYFLVRAQGHWLCSAVVRERQEIVTANGVIEVPKLRVESITVGDVEAREVEVICHDIPELAGMEGLLGLSFLKHFRTVMDYKEGYPEIS